MKSRSREKENRKAHRGKHILPPAAVPSCTSGFRQPAKRGTLPIWRRTNEDVMGGIRCAMAGQLLYKNVFSLQEIQGENGVTIYSVVMDEIITGTAFSFFRDPETGQKILTLIALDLTNAADAKAFTVGATSMLLEGDFYGDYSSNRDAYNAFEDMLDKAAGSVCQKSFGCAIYTLSASGNSAVFSVKKE